MKIVVLGDIHGRSLWKSIMEKENDADKFIFIGDYFDSREGITPDQQLINFQEIVEWRRRRVAGGFQDINLIGNHDYHYLSICPDQPYSNYQSSHSKEIRETLEFNIPLLQMAHAEGDCLFTHAGVSKDWFESSFEVKLNDTKKSLTASNVASNVNDLFNRMPRMFGFTMGANYDMSGNDICQTPIWIRPQSLGKSLIPEIKHVIGHTSVKEIKTFPDVEAKTSITLIDALAEGQYLIIIDGEISVGKIKF